MRPAVKLGAYILPKCALLVLCYKVKSPLTQ